MGRLMVQVNVCRLCFRCRQARIDEEAQQEEAGLDATISPCCTLLSFLEFVFGRSPTMVSPPHRVPCFFFFFLRVTGQGEPYPALPSRWCHQPKRLFC